MTTKKLTKLLALYLPYILLGLVATNFGEAWRLAVGKELGDKIMSMMGTVPLAFANPLPSLHPLDLLVGLCCGAGLRLAVYLRGKNAKKYRHGMEYGSARWGNAKDIEPFMAPKFADNIILTKTERLMMSNRPPDPKNARNKNVLVVGGSGSGKTRFWLKPNLLQCHSSYVVTDPKGSIVVECGNALLKNGYKLKILNTINFKKSMMATANAKSIEEIKSFLSRQKEVYKIPYETHPADRPRQCVFGGTSNALDFLPLDRSGNRRFIPVMVYPEQAEVHILEDEAASRAYIEQMWAEAMEIYRSGRFKLAFSPAMQRYLKEHQRDFMPEDTKAGMIQAYLDKYTGETVCSKQLYKEALNHTFDEPKQWEIREINEIMNQCITGWNYFSNPRMFAEYGRQKGWEREIPATDTDNPPEKSMDGFVEVTEQMELPF